jgi:hypothetical protein
MTLSCSVTRSRLLLTLIVKSMSKAPTLKGSMSGGAACVVFFFRWQVPRVTEQGVSGYSSDTEDTTLSCRPKLLSVLLLVLHMRFCTQGMQVVNVSGDSMVGGSDSGPYFALGNVPDQGKYRNGSES